MPGLSISLGLGLSSRSGGGTPTPTPATMAFVLALIEADSTEVGRDTANRAGADAATAATVNYRVRAPAGFTTALPYDQGEARDANDYVSYTEQFQKDYASTLPTVAIPCGVGGTRFTAGGWGVGNTQHENSIPKANAAIAAYLAANPSAVPAFIIQIAGGTNDALAAVSATTWGNFVSAAVTDLCGRVFKNGVSGATIDTSTPVLIRGLSPEFRATTAAVANAIEAKMLELAFSILPNGKFSKQAEGQNLDTGGHCTSAGQRAAGSAQAAALIDTTPPVITFPSAFSIYSGQKLAREIVTDKSAWLSLTGADATQFEIAYDIDGTGDTNITSSRMRWFLRWTGNGNAPAAGTYNVTINARGNGGAATPVNLVVTVVADYGSQVETIAALYPFATQLSPATFDGRGRVVAANMTLKRGLNQVMICVNSGAGAPTSLVMSNGLVGDADANNTGSTRIYYVYSAQDETLTGLIGLDVAGGAGSVFVNVVNVVGTVKAPSASAIQQFGNNALVTTGVLICPASGIIIGSGLSTGGSTPLAGQTNLTPPGGAPAISFGAYRTTTGAIGANAGFSAVVGSAFAKA